VLAVLEDAVTIFLRRDPSRTGRDARLTAEVEAWFATDDPCWPFSFVNLCAALELSPDRLRRALGDMRVRIAGGEAADSTSANDPGGHGKRPWRRLRSGGTLAAVPQRNALVPPGTSYPCTDTLSRWCD
jgi:hypothetical protein